jgi:putative oxidoreductase
MLLNRAWIQSHRDFFLDAIRIYLGVGLFIKGVFFLMTPAALAVAADSGWIATAAKAVPYVHIIGGAMLAAGVFTRIAALIQIPVVFVAVFFVNLPRMQGIQAREAVEFSALVLFLLAVFLVAGAGPLSFTRRWGARPAQPATSYGRWIDSHPDFFLDLIRAYLGLGLFIKGFYIMSNQAEFMRVLEASGNLPLLPLIGAHYVIPAHFAGGLMLLVGFATRMAALLQIPLLLGAVLYLYLPRFSTLELRQNLEFSALVLFLLCIFAVHGSGRYSVDWFGIRKEESIGLPLKPAPAVT